MMKKALTYLTILAITVLPVQLINASVEVVGMQMSMSHQAQPDNQCMLDVSELAQLAQHVDAEKNAIDKSCCDDQSHNCQSCDNCPQAITAMFLPVDSVKKSSALKSDKVFTSYLSLNGISQKNLLRPPRA